MNPMPGVGVAEPRVADANAGCPHRIISVTAMTVGLRFDPACRPRAGLRVENVCSLCGHLPGLAGLHLHPLDRAALLAARTISEDTDGYAVGFPRLSELASDPLGAKFIIQTEAKHRIDDSIQGLGEGYLAGLLRGKMRFRDGSWPRAVACPGVDHPIILHAGLIDKFVKRGDADHVRFAHYAESVISGPIEVWEAHDGRKTLNALGILRLGDTMKYMNVVAEEDNHICDTAYIIDRPERVEGYRRGRPLYLGWALKI